MYQSLARLQGLILVCIAYIHRIMPVKVWIRCAREVQHVSFVHAPATVVFAVANVGW